MTKRSLFLLFFTVLASVEPNFAGGPEESEKQPRTPKTFLASKNSSSGGTIQRFKAWLAKRTPLEKVVLASGVLGATVAGVFGAKHLIKNFQSNKPGHSQGSQGSGLSGSRGKNRFVNDFKGWGSDHKAIAGEFVVGGTKLKVASFNALASIPFKGDIKTLLKASQVSSDKAGAFVTGITEAQAEWVKRSFDELVDKQHPDVIVAQEVPKDKKDYYAPSGYECAAFKHSSGQHGLAAYVKIDKGIKVEPQPLSQAHRKNDKGQNIDEDGKVVTDRNSKDSNIDPRYAIYELSWDDKKQLVLGNVHLRMMEDEDHKNLLTDVNAARASSLPYIVVGDFNLDGNQVDKAGLAKKHRHRARLNWLADGRTQSPPGLGGTLAVVDDDSEKKHPKEGPNAKKYSVTSVSYNGKTELLDHAIYGGGAQLSGKLTAVGNPEGLWEYVFDKLGKELSPGLKLEWERVIDKAPLMEYITAYSTRSDKFCCRCEENCKEPDPASCKYGKHIKIADSNLTCSVAGCKKAGHAGKSHRARCSKHYHEDKTPSQVMPFFPATVEPPQG